MIRLFRLYSHFKTNNVIITLEVLIDRKRLTYDEIADYEIYQTLFSLKRKVNKVILLGPRLLYANTTV